MKVKTIDDLNENWRAMVSCEKHMCAKIGASRARSLFVVHNDKFCGVRTDERSNIHLAGINRSTRYDIFFIFTILV